MHVVVNKVIPSQIGESMLGEVREAEGTGEYVESKVYTCLQYNVIKI